MMHVLEKLQTIFNALRLVNARQSFAESYLAAATDVFDAERRERVLERIGVHKA